MKFGISGMSIDWLVSNTGDIFERQFFWKQKTGRFTLKADEFSLFQWNPLFF